jgi:hypothetical protein
MLFKVEVTDADLFRNWRGYAVKKLSYDEEIINRFTTLYGINVHLTKHATIIWFQHFSILSWFHIANIFFPWFDVASSGMMEIMS